MNYPNPGSCSNQNRSCKRGGFCLSDAIAFLAILFALALGVILGTVFAATFQPALAAVIAFAAAVAAILIALLIYRCCRNN